MNPVRLSFSVVRQAWRFAGTARIPLRAAMARPGRPDEAANGVARPTQGAEAASGVASPTRGVARSLRSEVRRAVVALGLMGFFVVLAACTPRETAVARGDRDQVLHCGNLGEPTDLDPQIITSQSDFNVALALFEGLTTYDPKDLHPVPGVAERWETSADGLTWTFHLRPEARWSNGEPLTAQDFVYAFQRELSPGLAADYAYMLYHLKNGEAYNHGQLHDFSQVGVHASDEHTLVLTLWHPVPYLLSLAAHTSWCPVHRATIEKYGRIDERGTAWTRAGNLVGNGPFVLKEWRPNEHIRVDKSPTYWDRHVVKLQSVYFYPIENESTEEAAFRTGQLHVTAQVPMDRIAQYRTDPRHYLVVSPTFGTYFYRFNVTRPPLNDARVRRALAMAIDREEIVTRVTQGGELPCGHLTPPNAAGFTARASIPTDIPAARKLLAEAGYPDGRGFPPVELSFNTTERHRRVAEAIQQMWHRNLGIKITLLNREAKVHDEAMRQLNYQIARYGWFGDYLDPVAFLELLTSDSGNNQTGWHNDEYDRLIALSRQAKDNAQRYEYFQRCEEIIATEVPLLPINVYSRTYLLRPEVKGWFPTLQDLHPLKRVYLDAKAP